MKAAFSRRPRRAKKQPRAKKATRLYGLPKRECIRRLRGVNCSLRDEEPVILKALGIVDDFLAHVRKLPCCICGTRNGSEAHHVMTRGAYGGDFYNAIPACYGPDSCHQRQHQDPDVDLTLTARAITETYLADHPDVAEWLSEQGAPVL